MEFVHAKQLQHVNFIGETPQYIEYYFETQHQNFSQNTFTC